MNRVPGKISHYGVLEAGNQYLHSLPAPSIQSLREDLRLVEFRKSTKLDSEAVDPLVIFPLSAVFLLSLGPPKQSAGYCFFASSRNTIFGRRGDWEESMPFVVETLAPGYALVIDKTRCVDKLGADRWSRFFNFHGANWALSSLGTHARCLGTHALVNRLAKVLLEGADAFGRDRNIRITQTQLGRYLSVRREAVNHALMKLVEIGALRLGRGHIAVLSLDCLQSMACACYESDTKIWTTLHAGWHQVWNEPRATR